jgi:hypothetical protein
MTKIHEAADYYQKNKESDDWGDPVPSPVKSSRRLGAMISVRFSPEEVAIIRARAAKKNVSVSRYVRMCALGGGSDSEDFTFESPQGGVKTGTFSTYILGSLGLGTSTQDKDLNLRPLV